MSRRAVSSIPERHSYAVRSSSVSKNVKSASKPTSLKPKNCNTTMIVNLLEFLEKTDCNFKVSSRDLNCPSHKIVFSIFEHILRQIDPTFCLPSVKNDWGECFFSTLRSLCYPGTLNKSIIATPGAPHSWPHVLSSLDWLRTLHLKKESLFENDEIFIRSDQQMFSEPPIAKTIWNVCLKSLADEENSGRYIQELKECIERAYGCNAKQMEDISKRINYLEAELASSFNAVDEGILQKTIMDAQTGQQKAVEESNRIISSFQAIKSNIEALRTRSQNLEVEKKKFQDSVNELDVLVSSQGNKLEGMVQGYRLLQERYDQRVVLMSELNTELQKHLAEYARLQNCIAPSIDKYNRLASSLVSLQLQSTLPLRLFVSQFDAVTEVPIMCTQLKAVQTELHSLLASLEKQTENLNAAKLDSQNLLNKKKTEMQCLQDRISEAKIQEKEIENSLTSRRTKFEEWQLEIDSQILEAENTLTQKNALNDSLLNSIKEFESSYEYYINLKKLLKERTSQLLTDVADFLSALQVRAEAKLRNSIAKSEASKALEEEILASYDALDAELEQLNLEAGKLEAELNE